MRVISAQYTKEIDTLRRQLTEARHTIDAYERTKNMQQESLKKAFMKGVCAMNMEAMSILNPSEQSNIEKKFESLAEGVFSDSTPIRHLAFNNSNPSEYKVYDSGVKEEEIFQKFNMHMSEVNEYSQQNESDTSIHHTPVNYRTEAEQYSDEKEIKIGRGGYTELETASMSKQLAVSAVKISKPGDDIVISNTKIESKDSMWKPAPVMHTNPVIVNNVQSASFGYKQNSSSLNPHIGVPKHTLGTSNSISQEMGYSANNSSFLASFNQISRPKNNNLDLIETLTPQPHAHPGVGQANYQTVSNINERTQVVPEFKGAVKENMSSNILDSLPSSNFPSVMNKSVTSTGGKTIRVNSK